ncbi:MAG: hypothetical protein ACUVWV_00560 [Thermodesulfobacteriota bacterium]
MPKGKELKGQRKVDEDCLLELAQDERFVPGIYHYGERMSFPAPPELIAKK